MVHLIVTNDNDFTSIPRQITWLARRARSHAVLFGLRGYEQQKAEYESHTRPKNNGVVETPTVILVVSRRRVRLCAKQTYSRYQPLQGAMTSLGPLVSHCARDDNVPSHSNHHLMVTFAFCNVTVCGTVIHKTFNSSLIRHSFRLCRSWFLCC